MAALARDVAHSRPIDAVLADVTNFAVNLIGPVHAADVLLIQDGKYRSAAPTSDMAPRLDAAQQDAGEGPCVSAAITELSIRSGWPSWQPPSNWRRPPSHLPPAAGRCADRGRNSVGTVDPAARVDHRAQLLGCPGPGTGHDSAGRVATGQHHPHGIPVDGADRDHAGAGDRGVLACPLARPRSVT